jgi:hypothetical protein
VRAERSAKSLRKGCNFSMRWRCENFLAGVWQEFFMVDDLRLGQGSARVFQVSF